MQPHIISPAPPAPLARATALPLGLLALLTACVQSPELPRAANRPPDAAVPSGAGGAGGAGGGGTTGGAGPSRDGAAPADRGPQHDARWPAEGTDPGAASDATTEPGGSTPPGDAAPTEGPGGRGPRAFRLLGVAFWRGEARGAYTILHESMCDDVFLGALEHGARELRQQGLRAAFSLVAGSCESGNRWPALRALVQDGHEIVNQSLTHPCLASGSGASRCGSGTARSADFAKEITGAGTLIEQRLGARPAIFVYPYDVCDRGAAEFVKQSGFLGARCGGARSNSGRFEDPYAFKFDPWGPSYSEYKNGAPCSGLPAGAAPSTASAACREHVLTAALDEAAASQGWVVRGFHGVDDKNSYEAVSLADYRNHLRVVRERVNDGRLWMAGPAEVIRYRFAREACPAPVVTDNRLTFPAPGPECARFATALSYRVATTDGFDPPSVTVQQDGRTSQGRRLSAGTYLIDANPAGGMAQIE